MKTADVFTSTAPKTRGSGTEYCLAIGTRLSDFEITGVLGEGGFGIVYVAFDHSLQRTVAIKEYMPGALAERGSDHRVTVRAQRNKETFLIGLNSFINEARFLAQFDHPSLVKVYRYWEQNDTAYMAMRYYDGRTIKDIVLNSPEMVSPAWCIGIVRQILDALDTLYTMKILHRDVSPDNIIVQANGDAVLLDFGSARQIIGDRIKGMTVILKPGYAPVEQYENDGATQQGAWTDIYALSAVMYFAMLKQAPLTSIGRMVKDPLLLLQRDPDLRPYGKAFLVAIDKGLAVQAVDRPQSIYEFRKMLGLDTASVPVTRRPDATRRSPAPPGSSPASSSSASSSSSAAAAAAAAAAAGRRSSGEERRGGTRRNEPPVAPKPAEKARPGVSAGPGSRAKGDVKEGSAPHKRSAVIGAAPVSLGQRTFKIAALSGVLMVAVVALYLNQSASTKGSASPAPLLPVVASAPPPVVLPEPEAPVQSVALAIDSNTGATSAEVVPASTDDAAARLAEDVNAVATDTGAPAPAAVATPAPPPVRVVPNTSYKLAVLPWGTVFVDGTQMGVSPPLKSLSLPPGKHQIRIVNPSFPDHVSEITVTSRGGVIEHRFAPN